MFKRGALYRDMAEGSIWLMVDYGSNKILPLPNTTDGRIPIENDRCILRCVSSDFDVKGFYYHIDMLIFENYFERIPGNGFIKALLKWKEYDINKGND